MPYESGGRGSKVSFQEYEDLYPLHVEGMKLSKELSELNNEINKEDKV